MKIDFSQVLLGLNGKALHEKEGDIEKDITLSKICTEALLAPKQQDLSGEEKVKRFKLAQKLYDAKELDCSIEDLALVKRLIGEVFTPLLVGASFVLLDPDPQASAPVSANPPVPSPTP